MFSFLFLFVSCEENDCDKITKKYNEAIKIVATAETSYQAALLAVNTVCAIITTDLRDEKSINVSDACKIAKQVLNGAKIAFDAANTAMAIYKTQVNAACAVVQ